MTLLMWNTKCEGYPFRLLSSGTFWSEAAIQSILSGNVVWIRTDVGFRPNKQSTSRILLSCRLRGIRSLLGSGRGQEIFFKKACATQFKMDKIFEFGMILGFLNYHPFVLPFEKECLSQEIFIRWLTSLTLPQTSGMKLLSETFLSSAQAILSIHLPQLTLGDKRI